MTWSSPWVELAVQVAVFLLGAGLLVGAGYLAAWMRHRPALARYAPAVQWAGAVAYEALAAATRQPGAPPDFAAARAVALAEGEAALRTLAPSAPAALVPTLAKAGLGAEQRQDAAFPVDGSTAPATSPG